MLSTLPAANLAPRYWAVIVLLVMAIMMQGPLAASLWTKGEHATPEHWAYHLLLESLGMKHHHGPGSHSPTIRDTQVNPSAEDVSATMRDTPLAVPAPPPSPEIAAPAPLHGGTPEAQTVDQAGLAPFGIPRGPWSSVGQSESNLSLQKQPHPPSPPPRRSSLS